MDDLPELPFEKVLGYLSFEDRLKSRAVSRRWYHKINSFRVKSLCYSERPGKGGLASGAFAENFIRSTRFTSFFNTFRQTVLSNLKRLRLSDLHLDIKSRAFASTIESFAQLEELYIIRFDYRLTHSNPIKKLRLNLPKLNSLHLEKVCRIEELTLDSPRLKLVKFVRFPVIPSFLRLNLVHAESVERLVTDDLGCISVKKLKNLEYLHTSRRCGVIDPALLSDLRQLKEVRLENHRGIIELFEQKQRLGRTDLKIYHFCGLLLGGPDDLATHLLCHYHPDQVFSRLAANTTRLADEIPFYNTFHYPVNVPVAPEREVAILKRYTALKRIIVNQAIRDVQRFLELLKNLDDVLILAFTCPQPQNLFDDLPEHSFLHSLVIKRPPRDFQFQFLFRMKKLTYVSIGFNIDDDSIRKVFRELRILSSLEFFRVGRRISIEPTRIDRPRKFKVSVGEFHGRMMPNLGAVLGYIAKMTKELEG